MDKNNVYESIMAGLNEALDDAKSEKPILKRHKVVLLPSYLLRQTHWQNNTSENESWLSN